MSRVVQRLEVEAHVNSAEVGHASDQHFSVVGVRKQPLKGIAVRELGVLIAPIENATDSLQFLAPRRKFWTFTVPVYAACSGFVDDGEQSILGREAPVALVVLCCELPIDQSQVRNRCMEVEGNLIVGAGLLLDKVLGGVVVHGITKLPRECSEK